MAKIEEITTILIDEIETFQKTVSELKKETKKIENTKFTVSTTNLNAILIDFNNTLNQSYTKQLDQLSKINNKSNKASNNPKWLIIVIITLLGFTTLNFSYSIYQYENIESNKREKYQQGIDDMKNYLYTFFKSHPKAHKQYQKWNDEK